MLKVASPVASPMFKLYGDISNRELCQATGKIAIFRNGKSDGFLWHSWLSWIQSKPLESGYMPGTIDEKIKDEDDDKSSLMMIMLGMLVVITILQPDY